MPGQWPGIAELRALQSEALKPGGLRGLLSRVARRIAGHAALLDASGRPIHACPGFRNDLYDAVAGDVARVRSGQAHSVAAEHDTQLVVVLATSLDHPRPVLVASGERQLILRAKQWLADAAQLLWVCLRADEVDRAQARLDHADSQLREAVLHLLLAGDFGAAERVAETLRPGLPDPMRVYVAECEPRTGARDMVLACCAETCRDRAWVVPCPLYARHVIIFAPVAETPPDVGGPGGCPQTADEIEDALRALAQSGSNLRIGASQAVALREVIAAYQQAFHALATARNRRGSFAVFTPREELPDLLGEAGRAWAGRLLAPLLDHLPDRPHDPDAYELTVTLRSWLSFTTDAAKQLNIHRNTLSMRLRRIEKILGRGVRRLSEQAILDLALRIENYPTVTTAKSPDSDIDTMFRTPAVRLWAQHQLAPLAGENTNTLWPTLRSWLTNDARLDATAKTLGISEAGARKRLLRLEHTFERALLHGPSARYDLWLALRISDGQPVCRAEA